MKILCLGDTHFRYKSPQRRVDDFFETQLEKFRWVMDLWKDSYDPIIQTGDLFDSPDISDYVKSVYMREIPRWPDGNTQFYTVCGQHDLYGHSLNSIKRTPINVLESAYVIGILGYVNKYEAFFEDRDDHAPIDKRWWLCYGCSFGQDIPKIEDESVFKDKGHEIAGRILVIHADIGDRPLWPGHEPEDPKNFLRKHPEYSLVIAGDYHYSFEARVGNRVILNPGALVRLKANEWDLAHHPKVAIFDTDTRGVEWVEVPHRPAEEVFDLQMLNEDRLEDERKERIRKLATAMEADKEMVGFSFTDNLTGYYKKEKVDRPVKNIIAQTMEG